MEHLRAEPIHRPKARCTDYIGKHSSFVNRITFRAPRIGQVLAQYLLRAAVCRRNAVRKSLGLAFCCLIAGCMGGQTPRSHGVLTGGIENRGRKVIAQYRCGACHSIPGIRGAQGVFGPPLNRMARRSYIGGIYPNNPANMTKWLISPSAMKPKTAMPDLGLSSQQARDVTAYLETLR